MTEVINFLWNVFVIGFLLLLIVGIYGLVVASIVGIRKAIRDTNTKG